MSIATAWKLTSLMGCASFLLGCGGSGSPQAPLQVAATYAGRTTGTNAAGIPLIGKVSIVVNADYTASMTVNDSTSKVQTNLTGRVDPRTGQSSFEDSTGKLVFAGYFSPNSIAIVYRGYPTEPVWGVPSAVGTWRNAQNGSSGKWSTSVPVSTAILTAAQANTLEANVTGLFAPGSYAPSDTQSLTCPNAIGNQFTGLGNNAMALYAYTDSSGNTFIVIIKNYPPGNGSWPPNVSFVYASLVASDSNVSFVPSWPSASVSLVTLGAFGAIDLPSG